MKRKQIIALKKAMDSAKETLEAIHDAHAMFSSEDTEDRLMEMHLRPLIADACMVQVKLASLLGCIKGKGIALGLNSIKPITRRVIDGTTWMNIP